MGLGVALKAFSAALFNRERSDAIAAVLADPSTTPALPQPRDKAPETPAAPVLRVPVRDSSVTLLATLQRESRLIDLVQEDLSQFSDAQVGAAARPCLQQCGQTLARHFALKPVIEGNEGDPTTFDESTSAARITWVGEGGNASSGKLIHPGWVATKVDLAEWTGDEADALVIAPAQIQAE